MVQAADPPQGAWDGKSEKFVLGSPVFQAADPPQGGWDDKGPEVCSLDLR